MKGKPTPDTIAKQLAQLYEDYYDSQIFSANGDYELTAWFEILKADPSAFTTQKIDTEIFFRELHALNVELFGLAWLDYNLCEEGKQDSSQSDVALCTEIMFAKSYLEQTKNGDIWSAAGFYNDTILQAAIAQNSSRDWSIPRDIPSYYERGVNSFPEESQKLFLRGFHEHFDKLLSDKECASRVANRLLSIPSWRDGIMIPQKLSSSFAQRIGFSPNTEALFLLQRLTVGLYRNARDYINAVNDYGSWELARKSAHDLRAALLEAGRKLLEKQNRSDMSKPSSA